MARTLDEIRQETVSILQDEYPEVQKGLLQLEAFLRFKSRKAVYELRDFLYHLAEIYRTDITPEEAENPLAECRTHLRRCTVEPLEYQAEKTFVRIDRYVRWFGWLPWALGRNPIHDSDFVNEMHEIQRLIAKGRAIKTEGEACHLLRDAFERAMRLQEKIRPIRFALVGLVVVVLSMVVGGVVQALCARWLGS